MGPNKKFRGGSQINEESLKQHDKRILVEAHHLNLSHPISNGHKGGSVRYIVDKQYSLCASEIRSGDGSKSLLPRCVPDLQQNNKSKKQLNN